ncbi:MAG TPA: copper oxidase [Candidatus Eremiobacteraceae bacterium]|nr:copper oxidase [Candidatus Eremiobacteraceae bacterium]
MSNSRRNFFRNVALFGTGLFGLSESVRAQARSLALGDAANRTKRKDTGNGGPPEKMVTPDAGDLPFEMDGATKVFHLVAEPMKRAIVPWKTLDVWGYNGSCPGPTIQVTQGDRVRIVVENRLPESTSMHWHGLEVPIEQDGVPWISQKPIAPGEKYTYEFTVHQEGTFFYHAHSAMQEMMGLIGFFIAHPKEEFLPRVDHDYGIVLQEWAVLPSNSVPNTASMEFNWLTFNGVAAPLTTPLLTRLGSRVRLRIVNLGMDHHPIHLHGHQFVVTGTEGGRAPQSTWHPMNTVLVGVAQARVVEFEAKYPGDWMIHCHLPHHMMNSMMDLLRDRQISTADLTEESAMQQMQSLATKAKFEHVHPSPVAPDANATPGFPQDAFMEMGVDKLVQKPETHGLPNNWSAGMMGMMTMLRVLPSGKYDEIMAMKNKMAAQTGEVRHES